VKGVQRLQYKIYKIKKISKRRILKAAEVGTFRKVDIYKGETENFDTNK